MPGEQSVRTDEASNIRKILEQSSPNSTYSFRTELLSEADSHKGHRIKTHRSSPQKRYHSRSHRDRLRDRDAVADVTTLDPRQLSRLIAHDELEAIEMRKVLIKTSERLEQESRRATDAETRAREAEARALAMQAARHTAQADVLREQETLKAYQAQLEVARNEIHRAQNELNTMAAERERAEEEAARERSKARALAKEIEIQRAIDHGREQGKTQGYVDGRKEGWRIGTQQGMKAAYKQMMYHEESGSSSPSSVTPPLHNPRQQPHVTSFTSTTIGPPPPAPIAMPIPDVDSTAIPQAPSIRTARREASHKRSSSLEQGIKKPTRVDSDYKAVPAFIPPSAPTPSVTNPERPDRSPRPRSARLTPSPSRERLSPTPVQNRPITPRHSPVSPLPGGYIPLQENGRVSLPPPHELDPPPPSPHTPTVPLPLDLANVPPQNLQPTITVEEPTPPGPAVTMPEPQPAPASQTTTTRGNIRPSKVVARDYALARPESPPLPPIPAAERPNKGKGRQRMGPPRAGTGLHAPGRSSPSDTSTEFSQFDIVEQPERARVLGRGNGSQLSVILEGGSTAAESPEPERFAAPRMKHTPSTTEPSAGAPGPGQGILDDPREYAEFSETPLTPTQLAHRRVVADQLRFTPSEGDIRNQARGARDDVSIKSSTTRASAPRRRPNVNPKMPERLAASREVEALEKQAEMYDAFGTGRAWPSFDSQSSPDDVDPPVAVPTRTPDLRNGHRRAMSSSTSVPEITIQPPSRPSSKGSKVSHISHRPSPEHSPAAMPSTPSRRHSVQGSPMSPSRIPLPQTSGQLPVSLGTPRHADLGLPAGFVPMQGPPVTPSRVPLPQTSGQIPRSLGALDSGDVSMPGFVPAQGPPMTPSRVPLPHTSGQLPMSLGPANSSQFGLPPNFVPLQGPPQVLESFYNAQPSKTPRTGNAGLPSRTPHLSTNTLPAGDGPSNFPGRTPSGIPLPLSTATTARRLSDNVSSAPRTGKTMHNELPHVAATTYEPAPVPPGFQYPTTPARMPLPDSIAGSPQGSTAHQTPWSGWGGNSLGAGATPGPSMPATLGRPMSIYAGDAGVNKKVSSTSLASLYKKYDPKTYVDPAYLASSSATAQPQQANEDLTRTRPPSRTGSARSTKNIDMKRRSYAASVETVTDEDDTAKA